MKPSIELIMPMLGKGTRMNGMQDGMIKPLILLPDGSPMFEKAKFSVNRYNVVNETFVVPEEYVDSFKQYENDGLLPHDYTKCPVDSLRVGLKDTNLPIVSLDCDIYADLPSYEFTDDDAHLFVFKSENPNKSFIRVGEGNTVLDIKEKEPVSDLAVFGAYMFKDISVLKEHMHGEYISDIVKSYLDDGLKVTYSIIDDVVNYGTEEEFYEAI